MSCSNLAPPTLAVDTRTRSRSNAVSSASNISNPFLTPSYADPIMREEDALRPDPGIEVDFQVEDNPFAFRPGQLAKLFTITSLAEFRALGGPAGLERGLQSGRWGSLNLDEKGDSFARGGPETQVSRGKRVYCYTSTHELAKVECLEVDNVADSSVGQHKTRRGRGTRRNAAYWKERYNDPDAHPFDERELLFGDEHGGLKNSRLANLDTQLKIKQGNGDDLIMSSHCARELGVLEKMSTDFEDPCLQSISGHSTAVMGILRNIQFRLKGSSITFRRNFWVCDAIDGIVDVMIGSNFIKNNFRTLFEKVKECVSTFATWFSKKKETPEQKSEREELERQQKIRVNELEIKRLQRENEMHQRASEANSSSGGTAQNGDLGGHH